MQSDSLDDSSGDGDASEERLKEMLAEIQAILDTQHRDSFSSLLAENCLVPADTLQVTGRHQYIFHKPAVMMCATYRRGACHIEHKSGRHKSEIRAKVEATQSALEVLRKRSSQLRVLRGEQTQKHNHKTRLSILRRETRKHNHKDTYGRTQRGNCGKRMDS